MSSRLILFFLVKRHSSLPRHQDSYTTKANRQSYSDKNFILTADPILNMSVYMYMSQFRRCCFTPSLQVYKSVIRLSRRCGRRCKHAVPPPPPQEARRGAPVRRAMRRTSESGASRATCAAGHPVVPHEHPVLPHHPLPPPATPPTVSPRGGAPRGSQALV